MGGLTTFNLRDGGEVDAEAALGTSRSETPLSETPLSETPLSETPLSETPLVDERPGRRSAPKPTSAQRRYLERGLDQPGGKLPLFDLNGQEIDHRTIRTCIQHGWAEPWFPNPVKPDWVVCRVTEPGRRALGA